MYVIVLIENITISWYEIIWSFTKAKNYSKDKLGGTASDFRIFG